MAFHPPMLYLGYVGFTVPFAFAIAALVTGRVGEGWLVETRRWTVFAWGFLTFGIVLGAWWSYETLGWGGYWAWDPVENASLLPWLTGTAFIHSVMVQERRGMLRVWNLSLICATFCAHDSRHVPHPFWGDRIGARLLRVGYRPSSARLLRSHRPRHRRARGLARGRTALGWKDRLTVVPGRCVLANNVVFAVFAFVVLLGTVWPLIIEAINGDRIAVGNPFFDRMTMPIGFVLLFLMAIAPVLPWRKASGELLSDRLMWPAVAGVVAMVLSMVLGAAGLAPVLAFGLAGVAGGSAVRQLVIATKRQGWRGLVGRTNGGMIVHIGVILIAVAFAGSNAYLRQAEFRFDEVGQTAELAGHEFVYRGTDQIVAPDGARRQPGIDRGGRPYRTSCTHALPVRGPHDRNSQTRGSLIDDVQLSVVPTEDASDLVVVRVTVQPLVQWLWIGGMLMAVGTGLALVPGRRRRPTAPTSALPVQRDPDPDPEPVPV